jgi:hypothetical protein
MASPVGTLEALAHHVGTALAPLETLLDSDNILPFFSALGLTFPASLSSQSAFMASVEAGSSAAGDVVTLVTQLTTAIEQGQDAAIISVAVQIVEQIPKLVTALGQVGTELGNLSASFPGMNAAEIQNFADNLAENVVGYLLVSYLYSLKPGLVGVATLLGLIDCIPNPGVPGDPTHPPFMSRRVNLSNIGNLLTAPMTLFSTLFDWGDPSFDGSRLFPRLSATFGVIGINSATVTVNGRPYLDATSVAFQANEATNPPQLAARSKHTLQDGLDATLPLNDTWTATVQVQGAFAAGLQATVSPPFAAKLFPPTGDLNGQIQITLTASGADSDHPLMLIGQTGGSRLQASSVDVGAAITATWDPAAASAAAEPSVQIAVTGGELIIDMSEADGFLSDVTSGTPIQATFAFAASWAPDTGLHVTGGAQLEIDLPLHLDLGPVTIPTLYLIGGVGTSGVTLEVSAALGITLGPIAASVDRVGLLGTLNFPSGGGNLGFANLVLGFKPPNGLGLSIDAGVIAGGGYISFDPASGQYSGVLALTLLDTIGITVIAVLDTILPDGSSGFSLLFVITFTLPPIQLGFGFTLTGVGGIGGVNRSMNTSALQAGFIADTLDSVMFPPDPIQNAPQIISDIRNFFPPADGRYLFGPLLQIGWGTPTLITLTVGAILEVPDPVVLALIGLVDASLPDADVALISLHIEVLGIIDFGAKTLSIDGSLYDSYILIFSVGGSMAFRLAWGDDPNFVFSFGGFNPQFNTDGLNVPQMARLSVSIGDGDNPRISANSYYAITSNSIQFGANVQAYASAAGFTISGYLGYDVLIIISPFSFEFDFQAGFDVSFEGLSLLGLNVDGLFSGPTPWHFHGDASISLLFFTVSASLDFSWGDSTQATIPAKPVLPDLFAALGNPSDWSAELPAGASVGVSLVTLKPADTTLRVHPMGTLTVREKVVPLDLPITRYGNATPSDGSEFSIQGAEINSQHETIAPIKDYFAAGQFLTLSDADKLSTPSFEKYDAGVTIGSAAVVSGQDRARTVIYQEYYIDALTSFSRFSRFYQMPAAIHLALSAQGAGFTSPLKNTGLSKYSAGPQPTAVTITDPPYVVASVTDLSVRSDISSASGTTYHQAQEAVQTYLAANPQETGNLQVVPLYEAAA